jgi:hypothetical protein
MAVSVNWAIVHTDDVVLWIVESVWRRILRGLNHPLCLYDFRADGFYKMRTTWMREWEGFRMKRCLFVFLLWLCLLFGFFSVCFLVSL